MAFGNLSKYMHTLPNSGALHHVTYISSLPDSFQDHLKAWHPHWLKASHQKDITVHCCHELMHVVWRFLFDDNFLHTYQYSMVVRCLNGIEWRVYPRIFTYSADYLEKVLLAMIRDKGLCLCPRSLVLRERLHLNTFSQHLGRDLDEPQEFPLAQMLVPDFMHEFELGVWKLLFTHLICLLWATTPGGSMVMEFNKRFRQVPTFGTDTICRFAIDTSEMKKLATCNFEDILQIIFDGLLPDTEENCQLLKLLYRTAELHTFAKMCFQSEDTIEHLTDLWHVVHRVSLPAGASSTPAVGNAEAVMVEDLALQYDISKSENSPIDLFELIKSQHGNPVYKNFLSKLKDHLLGRKMGCAFDGDNHDDFTDEDRNTVHIYGEKIYQVGLCRVNFTMYNNWHDYNIIIPNSCPDVMTLSEVDNRDTVPFWHGQTLGVYHAKVSTTHTDVSQKDCRLERMVFLFVRWFGEEPGYWFSFKDARLPKVGFVAHEDKQGRTDELLPHHCEIARQLDADKETDWMNYYVNTFVDRDMVTQYFGRGVAHLNQIQRQHEGMAQAPAKSSEDEDKMGASGLEVEAGQANGMDSEEEEEEEGITDNEGRVSEESGVSDYAGDNNNNSHYTSD
ncbi:hypothetical protein FA13DRAFT_1792912 [Coprinellus micaceus]|uniref:Uncharacterized protein n=1 Tax=Coprinellus micaceus TaxID=71717 RepID=A0A4Y7T6K3_COPMI|nr:hypothetical protein FA13DRAFT_1792912 [Coprinellus micaceus]